MASALFFENGDKSVIINETPTSLILTLTPSINQAYEQYFKPVAAHSTVEGKDLWTLDKTNQNGMMMVGQMIGNTNIKASFKFTEPISQPVTSEFLLKVVWTSTDGRTVLVEYTASSLALFCDRDFGQKYSANFKAIEGKFSMNLKHKPDGSVTGPGWLFWKTQNGVFEFFQQLTGLDIKSMVGPAPAKKSSWKGNNNSSFTPFTGSTPVNIPQPVQVGIPLPGMPNTPTVGLTNFNGPAISKNVSPATNLSAIFDSLNIPMERVQRTSDSELLDLTGDVRIGMWGPTQKLEDELKDYKEQYGEDRVKENLRVSVNGNTAIIITRKID